MNTSPIFTIIIPTFNREDLIENAINSVLKQSHQNFEIIIIDDGSTDNTESRVSELVDPRVIYIKQKNSGGSKARNTGIQIAKGNFIAFLDSDDTFLPNHLENALTTLEQRKNNCTYTQVIVNRGGDVEFIKPPIGIESAEDISEYLFCKRGFIQTSTLIVPSHIAKKTKYNESINAGQDIDYAISLEKNGAVFYMLPTPGAIWNDQQHENRLSNSLNPEQRKKWLSSIRKDISEKAYWAGMARFVAKGKVRQGNYLSALGIYIKAISKGSLRKKFAIVILLQIFLSPRAYRLMSDKLASIGIKP